MSSPTPIPPPIPSVYTRSGRPVHRPRKLADFLPSTLLPHHLRPLPSPQPPVSPASWPSSITTGQNLSEHQPSPTPSPTPPPQKVQTEVNEFGLFRIYSDTLPTHDPEDNKSIDDYCDCNNLDAAQSHTSGPLAKFGGFGHSHDAPESIETTTCGPFPNKTTVLLMN
jgi:hypothetical protein